LKKQALFAPDRAARVVAVFKIILKFGNLETVLAPFLTTKVRRFAHILSGLDEWRILTNQVTT
jgi:hypothetical protein